MTIQFKINDAILDSLSDIHECECDCEVVVMYMNDELITISYDDACELAEFEDEDDYLEKGAEYCNEVYKDASAWSLAEDTFVMYNLDDRKQELMEELVGMIPNDIIRYIDWNAYWENEVRHDYTETSNYIFQNQ